MPTQSCCWQGLAVEALGPSNLSMGREEQLLALVLLNIVGSQLLRLGCGVLIVAVSSAPLGRSKIRHDTKACPSS